MSKYLDLIVLALTQIGDMATTLYFMSLGIAEANKLLGNLMQTYGRFSVLFVLKTAMVGIIAYLHLNDLIMDWIVWAISSAYVGVILWNCLQIYKVKKGS